MNTHQYALLGFPVSGTKSPLIHQTSFSFNEIDATFEAFEVSPDTLGETFKAFLRKGYAGFCITIPHKEAIIPYLDELDPLAARMGAVNTIVVKDGKLKGYNTDGPGLVASLKLHGLMLKGLKVLILGAGGAAKGIAHALALEGVEKLDVYNRTIDKAKQLTDTLNQQYAIKCKPADLESDVQYDLVINTTSVGMIPDIDQLPIEPELFSAKTVFCDIVYKPHETLFLKRAKAMGALCIPGIEMLIFQALLAEQLWESKTIDLEATKNQLFKTEGMFK